MKLNMNVEKIRKMSSYKVVIFNALIFIFSQPGISDIAGLSLNLIELACSSHYEL